jgi:DNA-binding transcriptional regulator YiaG
MPIENSSTRTLRSAALALGGVEALAAELGVAVDTLQAWMRGDSAPPFTVFSRALDIVARGPFGPRKV